MKRYKLKSSVVVCIYLLSVGAIISSLYLTARVLKASVYSNDNLSYVYRNLIDDTVPVVSTDDGKVIKPFGGEEVSVVKGFYEKDAVCCCCTGCGRVLEADVRHQMFDT